MNRELLLVSMDKTEHGIIGFDQSEDEPEAAARVAKMCENHSAAQKESISAESLSKI
jgi:hypothetical protein